MGGIRPIPWEKFARIMEKAGWEYDRTNGDHMIFHRDGADRPLVIPKYKELPVFIIKNNLRTAGIDTKTYLEILGQL